MAISASSSRTSPPQYFQSPFEARLGDSFEAVARRKPANLVFGESVSREKRVQLRADAEVAARIEVRRIHCEQGRAAVSR